MSEHTYLQAKPTYFAPARRALDGLAALSRRLPRWTGALLLALGLWSIWFALGVPIQPP